jgi:DNA ligase (NAD+)
MLWDLGFRSPVAEKKVFRGIDPVIRYCHAFEAQRDDLPYEIDGMVIKVNSVALQEKLGMTTHHPRWAIAYKFKARQGSSILRAVEFQVGRTGSITPVAKIDPVPIGGVTDVIPYIVKSLSDLRTGDEQKIQFPTHCPVCGDALYKPEDEAVWRCPNMTCKAQVLERIIHFTSKDAMDIRGLGEANIRKFFELGWLRDVPSIYALPYDQIRSLEGYGEKSVTNLAEAIDKSRQQPLHRLITALGIRYVGETTAKALARQVTHLMELANYSREQLQNIPDVGVKVAESIYQFFRNADNLAMLQSLEAKGLRLEGSTESPASGNLTGKSFLFTGTLQQLKRSEAEAWVEQNGGTILSGVSSKLDFLVVGEDAGSKLEKARKIPSVRILDEDGFLRMSGYGTT